MFLFKSLKESSVNALLLKLTTDPIGSDLNLDNIILYIYIYVCVCVCVYVYVYVFVCVCVYIASVGNVSFSLAFF